MSQANATEKLRILLPHWIDHSHSHQHEFADWAAKVRQEGQAEIALLIDQAVKTMQETDRLLRQALEQAGGPVAEHQHHHHHHHD